MTTKGGADPRWRQADATDDLSDTAGLDWAALVAGEVQAPVSTTLAERVEAFILARC
jgi:hypothetical protein